MKKLIKTILLIMIPLVINSPPYIPIPITIPALLLKLVEPHEGRMNIIYKDPSGKCATGIGHLITNNDKLHFPLSNKQIDSIFYSDIGKKLKIAKTYYPTIKDSMKLYAIAWFAFVYGEANFKYLPNGIPLHHQIDNWCYYTHNGILIKSNNLKKILNDINKVYIGKYKRELEWTIK